MCQEVKTGMQSDNTSGGKTNAEIYPNHQGFRERKFLAFRHPAEKKKAQNLPTSVKKIVFVAKWGRGGKE